jgi:hypothetical protein
MSDDDLLADQRAFYRRRAPEYDEWRSTYGQSFGARASVATVGEVLLDVALRKGSMRGADARLGTGCSRGAAGGSCSVGQVLGTAIPVVRLG